VARAAIATAVVLVWAALVTAVEHALANWAPVSTWREVLFANLALALALTGSLAWTTRKRPLRDLGVALAVAAATSFTLIPLNVRSPGPVVWVVCDTLRADRMSLYGYERPTSPFFEEWSDELLVFDRAYSQASHTLVTAPSLLASLHPSTHQLVDYDDVLNSGAVLASESLSESGFTTFGISSNPHIGSTNGFGQGWDWFEPTGSWREKSSRALNERFFLWREQQEEDLPYFAMLWYIDPHTPFQWDADAANWAGLDPGQTFQHRPEDMGASATQQLRTKTRGHYDAAVRSIDNAVAELVGFMKAQGDYDDAFILFTSDHGESLWEHQRFGHNYGLYESLTHVPLAIRLPSPLHFPNLPSLAGRIETIASSVDMLPTTLDFLGIPADPSHQGRSLLTDIEQQGPGTAYLEQRLDRYGPYRIFGIREGPHKYIWVEEFEDDPEPHAMLFDLEADPGEQQNLVSESPELAAAFHERVLEARRRYEAVALEPGSAVVSDQMRRMLEQLGYVDGGTAPNEEPTH